VTRRVLIEADGGSRGNPGAAAAGAVLSTPDGDILDEAAERIGTATNNVAEYRGLLLGLARAEALGATEVEVINDSELIAKQVTGAYRVKHADMKPLHAEARAALAQFESGMASALGAMAATGACAVDENALPACARSVAALGCDGLGARLVDDPGALARSVTPACAAMLRCGAATLDDAGADAPDDADPLAPR